MPYKARQQAEPPTWNARRLHFVREYLIWGDAYRSARAAGYKDPNYGWDLLQIPHIKAEVEKRRQELATKLEVTSERIVEELAKIGFANMADYVQVADDGTVQPDFTKLTRDQAAALVEVTIDDQKVRIKLADKRAALVDLGKHLGLFNEKVRHDGQIQIIIKQYGAELAAAEAERQVEQHQNGSA